MEYDVLFKRLLKTFFRFFMELFFPKIASQLQWESIEFLDKEEHSQPPQEQEGQSFRRAADIVVKVVTLEGEQKLIHIEVEHPWRRSFPFRMYEYFTLLRASHGLPVFSIAIVPKRRIKPFEIETYREAIFGHQTLLFGYFHLGLSGLVLDEYWSDTNPVSWAFSAFMKKGNRNPVQLMMTCFRHINESALKDNEKLLLLDFIRTYYQLTADEDAEFRVLLRQEINREVREMELSYYGKMTQEATQQGLQRGIQQGIQQGMHLMLLQLLQTKFGALSQEATGRIEAIQSQDELTALAKKALIAKSLADLGLDGTV